MMYLRVISDDNERCSHPTYDFHFYTRRGDSIRVLREVVFYDLPQEAMRKSDRTPQFIRRFERLTSDVIRQRRIDDAPDLPRLDAFLGSDLEVNDVVDRLHHRVFR